MTEKVAKKGGFTLPGEAGYEKLTLELAEKWGADVIRDSDGTKLSPEILEAGYDIYSTICVIREHNAFAKQHPTMQMETILQSFPVMAFCDKIKVKLLDGYFTEQFQVDEREESMVYWQVFDRTENLLIDREAWTYDEKEQCVQIEGCKKYHQYAVNFFAYRIWEEISMYNHITNHWEKEHLHQIDPVHEEVREYLLNFMERWCQEHSATNVVRFTSLFYNSAWIWSSNERNRFLYSDWGSYDFTVSPEMFALFEQEKGYALTCEDFVNRNRRHNSHTPATQVKRDYMDFVGELVLKFAKQLIEVVHRYGKKAYVFYDDSWMGLEPYSGKFEQFGFDGLIKCVFSGYEVRMCAEAEGVATHEIRLHPYLFETGLTGEPVFAEGGDPVFSAKLYWRNVRRALLRQPVQRIGLGGYLHLTQNFPDFCNYIEQLADEFRMIKDLHEEGSPYVLPVTVSVLTYWGKLRSWTCGGHFHEHPELDLINLLESLSGLPVEVEFIDFEDLKAGRFNGNVIINAGIKNSAWSGGNVWEDETVVEKLTEFVYEGGCYLAVNESSETEGFDTNLRMAHLLGVDVDRGEFLCHGRYEWKVEDDSEIADVGKLAGKQEAFLISPSVKVLKTDGDTFTVTENAFGKGKAVYMASYRHSPENMAMLLCLLCSEKDRMYVSDNPYVECAYYPKSDIVVWINNSDEEQQAYIITPAGRVTIKLEAYEMKMEHLVEKEINALLEQMTLEEKVWMCHANSKFNAGGIERLGIEELSMMDGPHGVRSEPERHEWTCLNREEDRCTYLPTETALAATWNPVLARRFGEVLGSEARYRGKDIILGPGVNIIRSPLCGRNFEYMSEDPCVIEKLSPELVRGIESQDTAACVKHYALNNQETDRGGVNVEVSKRALHEIYLRGFYAAIMEGDASSVMGAYNKYENQHCCHNDTLVNQILKEKWGFEGVYLTDWAGCHDTDEAIYNGLDLEMGTNKPYNEYYLADEFLKKAEKSEEVRNLLDDKVRRLLRLMFRVHKFSQDRNPGAFNTKEHQQTAYDIATEAMVLLKNDEHLLPIDKTKAKKILVVGPNAKTVHAEGGSSSGVRALYEVTPWEGIQNVFSDSCEIEYESGILGDPYHDIPVQQMDIIEMKAGVRAFKIVKHLMDEEGVSKETTEYCHNVAINHVIADAFDLECHVCIPETGQYGFRLNSSVGYTLQINDKTCLFRPYYVWDAKWQCQRFDECTLEFKEGEHICLKLHVDSRKADPLFDFGWMTPSDYQTAGREDVIWEKAKAADYVIYCGGLDHSFDTEGMDRVSMKLPWGQDTVISRLAEMNPNTIVLITAGSPVEMPWIDKVKSVLWSWYAGMEGGNAVADILAGNVCPSGKMPFTLPYKYEDTPVARHGEFQAVNCKYNEDIFVGYRGFEHDNVKPMFPFGHGLSYSEFAYSDLDIQVTEDGAAVSFKVTNVGDVKAMETAQVYVGDPICSVVRPPKELRNFKKVMLESGETKEIKIDISARDLSFYDETSGDWKLENGEFIVFVGTSSEDIRLQGNFKL